MLNSAEHKIWPPNKSQITNNWKKSKRKVQGVPQSQTAALPRPREEEETDKSKQAQTEQTYDFFFLNIAEHENVAANKYKNANYCWDFHIYHQRKFQAKLSRAWKKFMTSGLGIMNFTSIYQLFWAAD